MKAIGTAIAIALICGIAAANPVLTKEQVCKLAGIILDARENAKYKGGFDLKRATYVPKEGVWRFSGSMGLGFVDIFEIRDSDGYYRLGTIAPRSFGPAPPRFRIAPGLRRKIRALMEEFAEERKHGANKAAHANPLPAPSRNRNENPNP